MNHSVSTIAMIGTYVPRQCGIATFTKDLRDAVAEGNVETAVISLDDRPEGYDYTEEVRFQIRANRLQDYRLAADMLNINQIDVAILQHEYGIFGGPAGRHVLELAAGLRMPLITTLHTVLREPSREQHFVISELARLSDRLVVMSELARNMLREVYQVAAEKVAVIPHGIPDVPFVDPAFFKDQYGLEGRDVLLTFGLLSSGKGIEIAIQAMPRIVREHPETAYVVLGATHPHILKREGNAYLHSLQRLAARLGVAEHVVFHNRYVTLEELCGYMGAADIYLSPYLNKAQIVSGTLAYAMGMGKAVVSTPYWYAEELLSEGRGRLVPFGDPEGLADAVNELLEDPVQRHTMRKRAYLEGRSMVWKEVGRGYVQLANEVIEERHREPRPIFSLSSARSPLRGIPEINIDHLRILTDDTGILQHAVYTVPDRFHGYCTDDNARALIAALKYYALSQDCTALGLAGIYMGFLYHAYNAETKRFRNFMSYDRRWSEDVGSEDVHGRVVWALGQTVALAPNEGVLSFATRLFNVALESLPEFQSPRAWAFALIGILSYLDRFPGDAVARRIRAELSGRLLQLFKNNATADWPWCEDVVTYDNAKLPHALIASGHWGQEEELLETGLGALEWLVNQQVTEDGRISIIGNQGGLERGGARARFDQQPIDAMALIEACAEAYRCTNRPVWLARARQCFSWFLGNNETEAMLFDPATGGCRDGLHAHGPNLNQGAESTLAWLMSLIIIHQLESSFGVVEEPGGEADAELREESLTSQGGAA
ncbi:MAG TPA: glycosyltransferase family 4 protein [Candidatus Sumerlaeota bacterium]|nr:glycosyltransferase family 4 protein [Candidatus Sumerlaeota bacterium]